MLDKSNDTLNGKMLCLFPKGDNQVLLKGGNPAVLLEHQHSGRVSSCKPVMTAGISCMDHIHYVVGCMHVRRGRAGSRVGQSGSLYLLFASALTASDWLALLNWALSTHTAALKLPDGWEGINLICRLQELLQSNCRPCLCLGLNGPFKFFNQLRY